MIKFNCTNCGKDLLKFKSQIPKSGKGYCSASCSTSYRNKHEYNPSKFRNLSGENNPMYGKGYLITGEKNGMFGRKDKNCPAWKGGRHQRKDGYFRITVDGERVLEHRYILEQLGLDIDNYIVHHKNGDPSDNSVENLEILSQSEHAKLHLEQRYANSTPSTRKYSKVKSQI